ncbi:MAG TPA: CYTH domain-containing protein [Candidatus Binataceae bacterium]|nr:CYTH domain-containing protein [Candidatus Binataceae bacterium]
MAKEIERKFLTRHRDWSAMAPGIEVRQGYLSVTPGCTVRVRTAGGRGYITVKSATVGITRDEYEYEIPLADCNAMLDRLCQHPLIEKVRYVIPYAGHTWEVDEFSGVNRGLTIAEIELDSETEKIELPDWVETEVTGDSRYYNANLVRHPYFTWK